LTTNLDFHVLDNRDMAETWNSEDPGSDHRNYPPAGPPPQGLRDLLFEIALNGGATAVEEAFAIDVAGLGPGGTQFSRTFATVVQNEIFAPDGANIKNTADDPYFGLSID